MTRAATPARSRGRRLRAAATAAIGVVVSAFVALRVADLSAPFPDVADRAPASVVSAADGTAMHVGLDADGARRLPFRLADASPHLVHALVAAEDRRFYAHRGVDVRALARAAVACATAGAAVEGGSTITMQTVRWTTRVPRSFAGKALQALRAWQAERRWSKDEILERYLDAVPLPGNLRGVAAACAAWFGKRPADVSADEAALIVSTLPAPTRFDPRRDPVGARARRDRVLDRMREEGALDAAACAAAKARPVVVDRGGFPDLGGHAWARAGAGRTTVEPGLERAVEALAAQAPAPDGVAVVVVDVRRASVRALVGARRADPSVLDATEAPRSAGSTVKPFLYALALDAGLVVPTTALLDLPWAAPDWAPRNFDARVHGPVTAAEALATSLNVPAVRLAAALPDGALAATLRRAGLAHVRGADAPGADLALGTDDVTPLELAEAATTLAAGGVHRPLRLLADAPVAAGDRVLSPGACALVTAALADAGRARPAGAPGEDVAWKTGTSSRRRDAWAAGWTQDVVVVVWRGRLDGAPDDTLVGARAAVPLLFDVLALADPAPRPFPPPADVEPVEVCADTGLAPGPTCPERRRDLRPRGAAPLARCRVHVRVELDATTGCVVCARCRGTRPTVRRDVALFPPAWAGWRAETGLAVEALPAHDPACAAPLDPEGAAPEVAAPRDRARLEADAAGGADVVVRVRCADPRDGARVVLDATTERRVPAGEAVLLRVAAGRHVLVAFDARTGRSTRVGFTVEPR